MKRKLRVLIIGQQHNFDRVLAANIEQWGHEGVILPSVAALWGSEVEGDILLYDVDEPFRMPALLSGKDTFPLHTAFLEDGVKSYTGQWPRTPRTPRTHPCTRLTIVLSSHSVSRTTLEHIGAIALLQKPFKMERLQRYLKVFEKLLPAKREQPVPFEGIVSTARMRILVVDDDKNIAESLGQCLREETTHEVAVAYDGLDALEQCISWQPHCVVTDLIMPWLNGYQIMRCLAACSEIVMPAFVILSALAHLEKPASHSCFQGNVAAYIAKPFEIDEVISAIQSVFITQLKSSSLA